MKLRVIRQLRHVQWVHCPTLGSLEIEFPNNRCDCPADRWKFNPSSINRSSQLSSTCRYWPLERSRESTPRHGWWKASEMQRATGVQSKALGTRRSRLLVPPSVGLYRSSISSARRFANNRLKQVQSAPAYQKIVNLRLPALSADDYVKLMAPTAGHHRSELHIGTG